MITMEERQLEELMTEAARRGAALAIDDMVCYRYSDACERLDISYPTLARRIKEGKIRPVDGRITGAEIRRYLSKHVGD